MPGNHADFEAYVAARWPSLVRCLVLLGCSRVEAEQVATTALAHCYGDWERVRRADDVDSHVYATVLGCLRHRRNHAGEERPRPDDVPDGQASDLVLLRLALQAQLEPLTTAEREALVLRFVADLDEAQVAEVLDVPLDSVRHLVVGGLARLDLAALQEVDR